MATRYGICTDYDYMGKRTRLTIWSGGFMGTHEGEAYSRPNGFTIKLDYIDEPIKLDGFNTRDETNFHELDANISDAINTHLAKHGYAEAVA